MKKLLALLFLLCILSPAWGANLPLPLRNPQNPTAADINNDLWNLEYYRRKLYNGTGWLDIASLEAVNITTTYLTTETINGKTTDDLITGPSSSTDNGLCTFDGTTGKVVQSSLATLTDSRDLTVNAVKAGGSNYLSFFDYVHTLTADDISNGYCDITLSPVITLADTYVAGATLLRGGTAKFRYDGSDISLVDLTSTSNCRVTLGANPAAGDQVRIFLVEKQ